MPGAGVWERAASGKENTGATGACNYNRPLDASRSRLPFMTTRVRRGCDRGRRATAIRR